MENIYKFIKNAIDNNYLAHSYLILKKAQEIEPKKMDKIGFLLMDVNGGEENNQKALIAERIFIRENEKGVIERKAINRILEFTKLKPVFSARKLIIIENAHSLTKAAANHLLKILEEPPNYIIFILITEKPNFLTKTIVSRCIIIANRQQLSQKKRNIEEEKIYKKIDKLNLNELFFLAEDLSKKKRKEIILFLDNWTQYCFDSQFNENVSTEIIKKIKLIKKTKSLIELTTANPRLMIEQLFITIKNRDK